jgi:hypothetical protein
VAEETVLGIAPSPPVVPTRPCESVEDVQVALNLQEAFPTPADGRFQFLAVKDSTKSVDPTTELESLEGPRRRYRNTKRAFRQAVDALASIFYPKHPQHLIDVVLRDRERKFQEALQTVYEQSPSSMYTAQARTARAVLVHVMPRDAIPTVSSQVSSDGTSRHGGVA